MSNFFKDLKDKITAKPEPTPPATSKPVIPPTAAERVDSPRLPPRIPAAAPAKPIEPANREAANTFENYIVNKGDSLWKIAAEKLGSGNRYAEIQKLNNLSTDVIHPGQVLKIPPK
ncbi:MAG: LysM peptidoglycan-binding domain-containing protein [Eubacteriaceae bacterium]|nr:LysM peptidoglycan-binding domain-containing protein [Eubacteriaceae bacterium]